jgi:glycosyltransferase involved in cell wall biosynthesis
MKIGFVTQWYPPETGSAALPGVIVEALRSAGHDVSVLTGIPNYPTGKLYAGYRYFFNPIERLNGAPVRRVPLFTSHTRNSLARMANYLSFATSSAIAAPGQFRDVDLVWVHGTPMTASSAAIVTKRLLSKPYILHIQDLWPETVLASGMIRSGRATALERPINWFCNLAYDSAAAVPVISPGMKDALVKRGVPGDKIELLPNWCDESSFRPVSRDSELARRFGISRPFTVMYAGSLGEVQGISVLVEAARLLRDRRDVGFAIVGDGITKEALRRRAQELELDNIAWVPSQPMQQMSQILALGDMQVISLIDHPLFRITLPSKVQATLAAGRPIICAAAGDAATVVRDAAAGLVVPPENATALASAIVQAHDAGVDQRKQWSEAGRRYYLDHLSESHALSKIERLVETAVGRTASSMEGRK